MWGFGNVEHGDLKFSFFPGKLIHEINFTEKDKSRPHCCMHRNVIASSHPTNLAGKRKSLKNEESSRGRKSNNVLVFFSRNFSF